MKVFHFHNFEDRAIQILHFVLCFDTNKSVRQISKIWYRFWYIHVFFYFKKKILNFFPNFQYYQIFHIKIWKSGLSDLWADKCWRECNKPCGSAFKIVEMGNFWSPFLSFFIRAATLLQLGSQAVIPLSLEGWIGGFPFLYRCQLFTSCSWHISDNLCKKNFFDNLAKFDRFCPLNWVYGFAVYERFEWQCNAKDCSPKKEHHKEVFQALKLLVTIWDISRKWLSLFPLYLECSNSALRNLCLSKMLSHAHVVDGFLSLYSTRACLPTSFDT